MRTTATIGVYYEAIEALEKAIHIHKIMERSCTSLTVLLNAIRTEFDHAEDNYAKVFVQTHVIAWEDMERALAIYHVLGKKSILESISLQLRHALVCDGTCEFHNCNTNQPEETA
jgi:hypothetical protein